MTDLYDMYTHTPAFEKGYDDARNGRKRNNPYPPLTTDYVDYNDGYHAYQAEAYR